MLFANNCNTTLNGGITAIATSMVVTSATGFPSPTGSQYFYCTLADAATQTTIEIVKVTAVSGTTFTIVRGQDGTTGTIFASGAVVSLRLVAASLNDFPKLDEANTFTGTITFSTPLLATNMVQSTTSTSGYLSNTDWTTFNGKAPAVTFTTGRVPYGQGSTTLNQSANLTFDGSALKVTNAQSNQLNLISSSTGNTQTIQFYNGSNYNYGIVGVVSGTGVIGGDVYGLGYSSNGNSTFTPAFVWNSIGNVGLGANPSTAAGSIKAIEANGMMLSASTATNYFAQNLYLSSASQYTYKATAAGSLYVQNAGTHAWLYAASGTAGTTVSPTQAMAINLAGGVQTANTISVGNVTPATSGAGITFPATQSASSDVNTLDDYEEGTWTPNYGSFTFGGTTTTTNANYVKIGKCVYITFSVADSVSIACTAGVSFIQGLPFTAGGSSTSTSTNEVTGASIGVGLIYSTNGRLYLPTFTAAANQKVITSAFYFV